MSNENQVFDTTESTKSLVIRRGVPGKPSWELIVESPEGVDAVANSLESTCIFHTCGQLLFLGDEHTILLCDSTRLGSAVSLFHLSTMSMQEMSLLGDTLRQEGYGFIFETRAPF